MRLKVYRDDYVEYHTSTEETWGFGGGERSSCRCWYPCVPVDKQVDPRKNGGLSTSWPRFALRGRPPL